MAKQIKAAADAADEKVVTGRLRKLTVKNFRAIGPEPVEIDLDDIVVLVGPNNSGKSSILRAYELAMSLGKEAQIKPDDYHNGDTTNAPEIQLVSESGIVPARYQMNMALLVEIFGKSPQTL